MDTCPNCGADLPPKAKACPECGSDEKTGWSEVAYTSDLDLPLSDEEFNYDKYVEKEFGAPKRMANGLHWFWWVVAVVLLAAMLMFMVF
jgi:hypothetical protein